MKRRKFIGQACRFAVLCSSPLMLSALQSCDDVESDNSDFVSDDDFIDVTKDYIEFNLNQAPFNELKQINGSIATTANDFDSNGLLLSLIHI